MLTATTGHTGWTLPRLVVCVYDKLVLLAYSFSFVNAFISHVYCITTYAFIFHTRIFPDL